MAVKIRLKRLGKIRAPYYRIVVADSRTKRDGRVIEEIGKYHPTEEPSFIEVDSERAQYWLGVGAQPTEQVLALLKLTGDWGKFQGDPNAASTVRSRRRRPRSRSTPPRSPSSSPRLRRRPRSPPRLPPPRRPRRPTRPSPPSNPLLAAALEHVVKGIVDHPDAVRIDSSTSPRGDVLEVHVHPDDRGRVIGRGGRTAKALRTLISALADGRRVRVDVADD